MNFETMFQAIHGYEPFPWQAKAARSLIETESTLSINVPTASGKTALIDAAVHAAAHGGPRRIAFIIDRRVVVDEAYRKALQIAESFQTDALREIAEKVGEIQVVRLRGGVFGDDDWVLYPDKLTIILSTVDQVGSRLLHRGYGVSPRMAPMHAGFVGNDAVYIIDEAHLSHPFIETIQSCRKYGADIRLVAMTATPTMATEHKVELSSEDRANNILSKRLKASKLAKLTISPSSDAEFVKRATEAAEQLSQRSRVVGVIVNRVASARKIWRALTKRKWTCELLTGRIRPFDRDQLMERVFPHICAGRTREAVSPLFVVATQTVEVGADIDFDALVTESAPLDSLRQRFGRLDRLGELEKTESVILHRELKPSGKDKKPAPDPIYGDDIFETWKWLDKVANDGVVDFGISAMNDLILSSTPSEREIQHAPVLLPSHVQMLSQTGPEAPMIDVSPYLHGAGSGSSDVSVVWRIDLLDEDQDRWMDAVSLRPPLSREALELPIYVVRSWLQGKQPQDVSDIEGGSSKETTSDGRERPALCWRGPDDVKIIQAGEIRPGDTLVVPASYGGCDQYGWVPGSNEMVEDVADYCSLERGRQHAVRLVPDLTKWLGSDRKPILDAVSEVQEAETQIDPEFGLDQDRIRQAHDTLRHLLRGVDHPLISAFRNRFEIELHPYGVILRGRILDEIAGTLSAGVAVHLETHLTGVAAHVASLTDDRPEREKLIESAKLHDQGKKEHRFQVMLHGDPLAAAAGPELAKSGLRRLSDKIAAFRMAGLPRGFRHELASLTFYERNDALVRHLIGSHHGYGRPWFPVCMDQQALGQEHGQLANGWGKNYASLLEKYGPWSLSGMELILRAADARQSIAEREERDE